MFLVRMWPIMVRHTHTDTAKRYQKRGSDGKRKKEQGKKTLKAEGYHFLLQASQDSVVEVPFRTSAGKVKESKKSVQHRKRRCITRCATSPVRYESVPVSGVEEFWILKNRIDQTKNTKAPYFRKRKHWFGKWSEVIAHSIRIKLLIVESVVIRVIWSVWLMLCMSSLQLIAREIM